MAGTGPFGFDPDEFDRIVREAGEGLREALDGLGWVFGPGAGRTGWAGLFDEFSRAPRQRAEPRTTGDAGDGVWVIYTVDAAGAARVEQVFPGELEALRANRDNTDPARRVRFLPYGMPVSVLDSPDADTDRPEPS